VLVLHSAIAQSPLSRILPTADLGRHEICRARTAQTRSTAPATAAKEIAIRQAMAFPFLGDVSVGEPGHHNERLRRGD
jgi:hypothetical protein